MSRRSSRIRSEGTNRLGSAAFVYWLAVLILFVVVCVPHFWNLGDAPRGFFGDEASNAYNAYSIALTGADEYIDTNFKPFAYIFLLFHGKIDPWSYQHGGFSNTVIRPYLESIDKPGLLLRCNNTSNGENNQFLIIPNYESVPPSAALLITFQDEDLVYQGWRVKEKWVREDNAIRSRVSEP